MLGAFHARNVIHRDIKPGNLFITKSGIVKVLDFGLARLRDPKFTGAPTASGIVLGTASYMPPEQAQGKSDQVDARSDIFAVGAVMFRVLTGRAIHEAKSATERLFQAMKERAPSLGIVAPHMPTWVVGVVDKALAFDKKDRWETADEMRKAVRETFAQLKEHAQRVKPAPGAAALEHDGIGRGQRDLRRDARAEHHRRRQLRRLRSSRTSAASEEVAARESPGSRGRSRPCRRRE